MHPVSRFLYRSFDHVVVGGLSIVVLCLVGIQISGVGGEPASLVSPGPDESITSWAVNGMIVPVMRADWGAGQRGEAADALDSGTEPVTASLWLAPIASLGAGTGLGWYEWYERTEPAESGWPGTEESRHEFRVRLGGGLMAPLTPSIGVDLRGEAPAAE